MSIDVNDIREADSKGHGIPLCDDIMTFFYDETGNCGKFSLNENGVNDETALQKDFILGGVAYDGSDCPADAVEAEAAVKAAYAHQGPVYLRFGRLAVPVFHEEGFEFTIGKGEVMRDGTDVAIIANGLLVYEAVQAGEKLAEQGINAMIINMSTVKPIDEELVLEAARKCGRIITCEEHSIVGGLGEAVCSVLSEKLPTPVRRIGVNDVFGESGPAAELLKKYGLCADNIVEVAKDFCGK